MQLLYFATPEGNFGDDLNTWLWDALLPGWRGWDSPATLVGVGTILKQGFLPEGPKLVLGSGVGYGTQPDIQADPQNWDIRAVRGPRTAAALGLPAERAFTDAAVLIPGLPDFAPETIAKTGEVLFVPHYKSVPGYDWPALCARAGLAYQSPSADSHTVIRRIAGARAVVAESMHAAIIADAFGVPWHGVAVTAGFNHFKWGDWAESLGMPEPRITRFFGPLRQLQDLLRGVRGRKGGKGAGRAAPKAGGGEPGGGGEGSMVRRLRPVLEPWAVHHLRACAKGPFTVSAPEARAAACDRFRTMLDGVRRDYG